MIDPATAISLAKMAGYTFKDITGLILREPAAVADAISRTTQLREILTGYEDPKDRLTGSWELFDWPNPPHSESMKGLVVTEGNLSIFYRRRSDRSWHGIMTHIVKRDRSARRERNSDHPFTASYEVSLQETNEGIVGTSNMMPDKHFHSPFHEMGSILLKHLFKGELYRYKGNLSDGVITGLGAAQKFEGNFQTTKKSGIVAFQFAARRRWSQVHSS